MENQNFIAYIKNAIKKAGITGNLIAISVAVSLFFGILMLIERLFVIENLTNTVKELFAAPGNPELLLYKPWSLITQMFTHGGLGHLAFNMLALYFIGRMFIPFFGQKRLLSTYLLGGVFAYLFHIAAYYIFPVYADVQTPTIVGASASIYALFAAIVVHKPDYKVQLLFLRFQLPLVFIFALYILGDLRGLATSEIGDSTAYFAHIGGAVFGGLSVLKVDSPKNFMNRIERWLSNFKWPSFKRKAKMKVYKTDARSMTDDDYNYSKNQSQQRVDAILDKISKKGYEGLTKEEKEILFNESKRKK